MAYANHVDLEDALTIAKIWSDGGYTVESRAYWQGMRDTLAVVLGYTTECPMVTGPGTDVAAFTILGTAK